jgi:hypothetical protein
MNWLPIEIAPENEAVLATNGSSVVCAAFSYYYQHWGWWGISFISTSGSWACNGTMLKGLTHWMPLPESPKKPENDIGDDCLGHFDNCPGHKCALTGTPVCSESLTCELRYLHKLVRELEAQIKEK